jgi:hypothetical protein
MATDKTRRAASAGFFVRKVADVAILSKELRASRGTFAGREGSYRTAVESDPGIGGLDRGYRLESEAAQQIKGLIDDPKVQSSLARRAMAPAVGWVTGDFRLGEFAFRAFKNMFLRAVGGQLPACQLHSRSTHGAAWWLDRLDRRRGGYVSRRHGQLTYKATGAPTR